MPRFFFHIRHSCVGLSRDELGLDCPDAGAACRAAFRAGLDLQREFAARDQCPQDYSIVIANAAHELVAELPFSEVFGDRITPEPHRPNT